MGPTSPLTVDGEAIGRATGGLPGPRFAPGRHLDLPRRGRTFVREVPGPAGAPTLLLLHGWAATGWPQLVPGVRASRLPLPGDRAGPPRSRPGPALAPGVPARRLRRRLRGDAPGARHRTGDRGRLLDGRTGRAAAVAPPPRPRLGARASARRRRASCPTAPNASPTSRRCSRRSPRRAPRRSRFASRRSPRSERGRRACRHGSPTRRASTTRARWSKPGTRSARTTPDAGSARSTFRPRSCARRATTRCGPTYSSRSPRSIAGATVHPVDDGHLACAHPVVRARALRRLRQRRRPRRRRRPRLTRARRTSAAGARRAQLAFTQPRTMPLSASGSRSAKRDVPDDREQQPDREPVVHERRALPPRVGERLGTSA